VFMLFQEASFVQGGGRFGCKLIPSGGDPGKSRVPSITCSGLIPFWTPEPRTFDLITANNHRPGRSGLNTMAARQQGSACANRQAIDWPKAPRCRPSGVQVWWKAASNRLADRMLTLLRYL
jgi:hypothetical protein